MILLASTTTVLRVVTGAAANVTASVEVLENDGTLTPPVSPIEIAPQIISTAATTTLVAAPASGKQRNVKGISLTNNHASASTTVNVQKYNGTTAADLMDCTLLPGENLVFTADGEWKHHDANGAEYASSGSPSAKLGATGTIAETMPRETCPEVNTAIGATGVLFMQAIYLYAGQLVSNISFWSATTASGTPTHGLFGLFDANRNLLASSADFTSEAWAANSIKTKAMTAAYKVPVSGLYYVGVMLTATTMPTLKGGTAKTGGQLAAQAPILNGTSSTGLTTALPNPAAAITAGTASIYGAVS